MAGLSKVEVCPGPRATSLSPRVGTPNLVAGGVPSDYIERAREIHLSLPTPEITDAQLARLRIIWPTLASGAHSPSRATETSLAA